MSEHLEFYQQQASTNVSAEPWLAELKQSALDDFSRLGFPTRHHEEWKYTRLDAFLQQAFTPAPIQSSQDAKALDSDISTGFKVDCLNGRIQGLEVLSKTLPKGVIVAPLSEALTQHADKLKPYLGKLIKHEHGFQALNTAMLQTGLFIYLPSGVRLDTPLLITHWQDKSQQAVYLRHVMVAEKDSGACVIEDYQGEQDCCYFTNVVTEIYAEQGAYIQHYKMQRESQSAYHIGHLAALLNDRSQIDCHSLSLGGKLVRSDVAMNMVKPHARCLMNGIYAPREGQHVDHHTLVEHQVPDCVSQQDYKGILSGASRAVFNGKVYVAKDAQHTEAQQQNKNILLSAQAEIDTKPQLEIFADDVVCTHGATVGQLDEEALFYLATRGIEREEASRYLIQAFAAENLRLVPDENLSTWMGQRLTEHLG